jgi:hypothetical protein
MLNMLERCTAEAFVMHMSDMIRYGIERSPLVEA